MFWETEFEHNIKKLYMTNAIECIAVVNDAHNFFNQDHIKKNVNSSPDVALGKS